MKDWVLGSLRRSCDCWNIDLAVMTDKPTELMEYLLSLKVLEGTLDWFKAAMFIHSSGRQWM